MIQDIASVNQFISCAKKTLKKNNINNNNKKDNNNKNKYQRKTDSRKRVKIL